MLYVLNTTTNPGQPKAAKLFLGSLLLCRGPPKDHLVAFGCPGFVVEFITSHIIAVESHVVYLFLVGRTFLVLSKYRIIYPYTYMRS